MILLLFPALKSATQKVDGAGLLLRYQELKEAFLSSDAGGASANALSLKNAAGAFDLSPFSEDKRKSLRSGLDILLKESAAIASGKDIVRQREHFAVLSEAFIRVATLIKPGGQTLYVQYCPMKKSSWLSPEKTVLNPYYGQQMLNCGKITQTLP